MNWYWPVVSILIIAICYWTLAKGEVSDYPVAILVMAYIAGSMFGVLNGKKRPVFRSLHNLLHHANNPWVGISALVLALAGIIWLYMVEHRFVTRILGLMIFFTTVHLCLDIGDEAAPSND